MSDAFVHLRASGSSETSPADSHNTDASSSTVPLHEEGVTSPEATGENQEIHVMLRQPIQWHSLVRSPRQSICTTFRLSDTNKACSSNSSNNGGSCCARSQVEQQCSVC